MADLGAISLWVALALASYSAIGSVLGKQLKAPALVQSAQRAAYLVVLALLVAKGSGGLGRREPGNRGFHALHPGRLLGFVGLLVMHLVENVQGIRTLGAGHGGETHNHR